MENKKNKKIVIAIAAIALGVASIGYLGVSYFGSKSISFADAMNYKDEMNRVYIAKSAYGNKMYDHLATGRNILFEEKKAEIEASTVYVKKDTSIYDTENFDGVVVKEAKRHESYYVLEIKKDSNGNDISYLVKNSYFENNQIGWIKTRYTVQNKIDLISRVYEGVDYSPFEKAVEYENNPKVKVRGIYMSAYTAAGQNLDSFIKRANETDINAFVIDVKDDNGNLLFYSNGAEKYVPSANSRVYIKDMESFIKKCKDNDIYLIARIVTFKSPRYSKENKDKAILEKSTGAPFKSSDGIYWASPHDRDLWDYDITVAEEAANWGFNEIQFDYVRFPASNGGKLDSSLDYRNPNKETKPQAIQGFLKEAYGRLSKKEVYIAADVFGWVASATNDVGIGQHWEGLTNVVDYMCPMMYPSHYGPGLFGFKVPDANPYGTIAASISDAIERDKNVDTPAALRPWIQDFTARWVRGYIPYQDAEVRAQIKALKDNGVDEYILWNASNRYHWGALNND